MRPYVVRQGDYLTQLAHRRSCSTEEVWHHPLNDALRKKRVSPDILQPGDILHLPDVREGWRPMPLATGGENRFTARIPTVEIQLVLERADRTPIANRPFRVDGIGPEPFEGTTDTAGLARFFVPLHVRQVNLILSEEGLCFRVRIGHMDPADESSGVAKRLAHLGHLQTTDINQAELTVDTLAPSIAAFQEANGLTKTGILDDATRSAIAEAHKS